MCIFACEMGLLNTAHQWVLTLYPICQSLMIGTFSPFTFNVNIVMCEFDMPFWCWLVVLPFGWCNFFIASLVFTIWFSFFLSFCSGWYWFFLSVFSASFRSSCRAGLVVTKFLSNCLSIKDFISPSLMKLSLAGYEILGWKLFSLRCWILAPTLFRLVGFLQRYLLWVWWASLCGWPDLSLWLPLAFFLRFNPGESDDVPWGVSLWCSLFFLYLNVGLPC